MSQRAVQARGQRGRGSSLRVGLAAACAVLLGCAAGPAPRDHFYRLDVGAPSRTFETPPFAGTLEVRRFRADALTEGRLVVFRHANDPAEVQRHAYHRWLDSPTAMLQEQMATYLRAAHAAPLVVTPVMRVRPDYALSGRVVRFERVLGGSRPGVVVELEFTVTREADRELLLLATYREEREAEGDGVGRAALAFNRSLADILDRFLADASAL